MVDITNKKNLNPGYTVNNYLYKDKQVRYYGDFFINIAFSEDGENWLDSGCVVLGPKDNSFDYNSLTVMGTVLTTAGILVIYDSSWHTENLVHIRVGMALFDPEEPMKLLWRSENPLYQYEFKTKEIVTPEKAVQEGEELSLSWTSNLSNGFEVNIPHPYLFLGKDKRNKKALDKIKQDFNVSRHQNNPIIEPINENEWESKATFNPAAIYAGGKVHLIYRAIGHNDMSVLGYVSSENGFEINERLSHPIYMGKGKNEQASKKKKSGVSPISYISGGGGEGGCEDPRLTLVEDTLYLTYTAFDGWGSLRMALSSISLKDFLKKEWNWKKPITISPPGEIHKNWVIFPEKINGKFAVLHSINPDISVEYLENLDFRDDNKYVKGFFSTAKNKGRWDSWVRGAGPPPIKTSKGWLLLYHAMDVYGDPDRYKMGAMILDLEDPQKIIARSKEPILEPDEHYENDGWKAGVLYCCGAVEKEGQLLIYYGGADTVSCVAETNLEEFVEKIIDSENPKIKIRRNK
ncbi:hypothetical protein KKC45_01935 [Patescibacteria group bacterium]|nr:hypothetical protein [Patescibacteria group bacterium]